MIAIDPQLRIITINHAARELLDLHQPAAGLLGRPIGDVIERSRTSSPPRSWAEIRMTRCAASTTCG